MICVLQDLSVERINPGFPLVGRVLWKGDKGSEPLRGLVIWGCHKFDDCRCIDKQSRCLLAENIDIGCEWPILCDIRVTPVFGDIGQTRSEEQSDVGIDQWAFDVMEFEHFGEGSEGGQTKPRADSLFGSSGDEELDVRYLIHIAGEDR